MWWIISIAVISLIIYNMNKDYKEHVDSHVTKFGGMKGKYNMVIEYLKSSGLQVQKMTKDSIILTTNSATWTLDYVGCNLEVRMEGYMPILGNISKKWIFPNGYPQEKMIEEFNNYAEWQIEELKKAAEYNAYEHINIK